MEGNPLGTLCLLALVQEGYVTSAYTTDALNLTDLISETDLPKLAKLSCLNFQPTLTYIAK